MSFQERNLTPNSLFHSTIQTNHQCRERRERKDGQTKKIKMEKQGGREKGAQAGSSEKGGAQGGGSGKARNSSDAN